ncbi:hypothetical protein AMS68_000483 [Peltaster fructicola]|uniref:Major facilitator superfamily (MFS) profile domain-containing protein n=1 Tax=Peltaster fructicola TaxID=286661 RepID=A0A6H0XJS5_9PEZI|nr:hypothetical protein AMS68_000483 [Peltaster fructicola]
MATTTILELQTLESKPEHVTINTRLPASTSSHERIALPANESADTSPNDEATTVLSTSRTVIVIAQLIGLQLFSSFCNGIAVVGLPAIIDTIELDAGLLLWPTSVFYLTAGSCLMLAGSITDVLGTRPMILAANMLLVASAFACGVARTGSELIAFRGLQGISFAMAVPASVSVISTNIASGRPRNLGFSCLGFSSPLGFLLGLVLGGVMVDNVGWRPAFHLAGATTALLCVFGFWALPHDRQSRPIRTILKQLALDIDWVGTIVLSAGITILSYVLAMLSSDIKNIRSASNISLLVISVAMIPVFIWWMDYQVKHNRPAVMPNSLWHNSSFTSICIMVLLSNSVSNNMELFCSLFFQQVQGYSALEASIRILPALVTAVLINISIGYFVNRLPVMLVVSTAAAVTALSPLLMAVIRPQWPYWYMAFPAQGFLQVCTNTLFTVGLLIISAVFPSRTQALGGAVFNTCAQLGTSIGLTITQVITELVTANSQEVDKSSPSALMDGYRAVFWTLFAMMVLVGLTGALGLRRVGKIGVKQD